MEEEVLSTLSTDSFWSVNKKVARKIGIEETVLLSELLYRYKYFRSAGKLRSDKAFYATTSDIQNTLGISKRSTERIIKSLVSSCIVSIKLCGVPAKKHWYINWKKLHEIIADKDIESSSCNETESTGWHETVSTSCNENVSTGCNETVSTSCNENVSTGCNETVSTSCNENVSTGCNETVSTIYNKKVNKKRNKKEKEKSTAQQQKQHMNLSFVDDKNEYAKESEATDNFETKSDFENQKANFLDLLEKLMQKTKFVGEPW